MSELRMFESFSADRFREMLDVHFFGAADATRSVL